jgi:hypothetical protein
VSAASDLFMDRTAVLSDCQQYRYQLGRRWGDGKALVWIMLNPSTADHIENDATIRKCIGFTNRLGFNALTVVNLFAFRARDPKVMRKAVDPVGPDNDQHIADVAGAGGLTICAWGLNGGHLRRDLQVIAWLRDKGIETHCLRITGNGSPGHPLMLPYELQPVPFRHK